MHSVRRSAPILHEQSIGDNGANVLQLRPESAREHGEDSDSRRIRDLNRKHSQSTREYGSPTDVKIDPLQTGRSSTAPAYGITPTIDCTTDSNPKVYKDAADKFWRAWLQAKRWMWECGYGTTNYWLAYEAALEYQSQATIYDALAQNGVPDHKCACDCGCDVQTDYGVCICCQVSGCVTERT